MKNTNERIEEGIDTINRKAMALKKNDWSQLSDQLRDLRKYLHDLEYWLDGEIRTQVEAEAERKANAIVEAGFSFDRIVVDKVSLVLVDGKLTQESKVDDEIPF